MIVWSALIAEVGGCHAVGVVGVGGREGEAKLAVREHVVRSAKATAN